MQLENSIDVSYRLPGVPERREGERGWPDRLDDWLALRKVPRRPELPQVRAGRDAELSLHARLGKHESTRFGEIFGGKRVPRRVGDPQAGRYEIDLIVITPRRLHVIEVKNWSGRLTIEGDAWVHDRFNGERKVFKDLTTYNHAKAQALSRYLASQGAAVPPERVTQTVVFTNPRLQMDRRIEEHRGIVTAQQLERYLCQQRGASRLAYAMSALIQACAEADECRKLSDGLFDLMSPLMVQRARDAIARLQTWDRMQLHGGRELIGDLLWLHLADTRTRAEVLSSGTVLELTWRRGWSGLLPLTGLGAFGRLQGAGVANWVLSVRDVVYFHEAGQPKPAVIALRDADRIVVG
jgi:hypothetical protein